MVLRISSMIATITDSHPCSRVCDDIGFTSRNQLKPNQSRLMNFHHKFNILFSIKGSR